MDAWQEWKTTGCHQNGLDIFFELEILEKLGFHRLKVILHLNHFFEIWLSLNSPNATRVLLLSINTTKARLDPLNSMYRYPQENPGQWDIAAPWPSNTCHQTLDFQGWKWGYSYIS